jgi:hypothetical protein
MAAARSIPAPLDIQDRVLTGTVSDCTTRYKPSHEDYAKLVRLDQAIAHLWPQCLDMITLTG